MQHAARRRLQVQSLRNYRYGVECLILVFFLIICRLCCALLVDPFHPWIKRTSHGYHSYPSEAHTPIVSYCWPHGPNSTSATQLPMDKMFYSSQQRVSRLHIDIAIAFRYCSRLQISQLHSEHQPFMRRLLHLTLLLMLLPLWSFFLCYCLHLCQPLYQQPNALQCYVAVAWLLLSPSLDRVFYGLFEFS